MLKILKDWLPITAFVVSTFSAAFSYYSQTKVEALKSEIQTISTLNDMFENIFADNCIKSSAAYELGQIIMPTDQTEENKNLHNQLRDLVAKHQQVLYESHNGSAKGINALSCRQYVDQAVKTVQSEQQLHELTENFKDSGEKKVVKAKYYERKGFEALLEKKEEEAQRYFSKAEHVYPTFHNTHEIQSVLKEKDVPYQQKLQTIVDDYSWGMPENIRKQAIQKIDKEQRIQAPLKKNPIPVR